jgi:GxxExxY protein
MNKINNLTFVIRGCIYETYNKLGPCLLESAYETFLFHSLTKAGLSVERQLEVDAIIANVKLERAYRIDLLVEKSVIIEIKSINEISSIQKQQLLTYLKLSNLKIGLLVNFCCKDLNKNIVRIVNNLQE